MMKQAFLAEDTIYYEKLGLQKEVEIWEDGIRTNGSKGSYEWWYFDAEYSNGFKVVVIFYTKDRFNINGPSNPIASIDITLPNGNSIYQTISGKKGEIITASTEKCDVNINDSSIKYVDGNYIINFICSDIEYNCVMKPTMPMWRPETGHVYFGDKRKKYFAWLVAVPSADVTTTLKVKDTTISMTGIGYHDHNWGNAAMEKLINHWYWCRANIDGYTVAVCDIVAEKKYNYSRIPLILLGKDGVIIDDDSKNTIIYRLEKEDHPITKKFIHNNLTFIQKTEAKPVYKVEFLRDHDITANNLINVLGYSKVKMLIRSLVGKIPTYLRSVGIVQLTILEDSKKTIYEKEALWEQMFFGDSKLK